MLFFTRLRKIDKQKSTVTQQLEIQVLPSRWHVMRLPVDNQLASLKIPLLVPGEVGNFCGILQCFLKDFAIF